jgi:vancomycin resistance protein YoaR
MSEDTIETESPHEFWSSVREAGPKGRAFVWAAWIVGLLVFAAAYVGAAVFLGRHVPPATEVGGVAIGGRSHDSAAAALERGLADEEDRRVQVLTPGSPLALDPGEAGLRIDVEGSLDGLTGLSLNPVDLLNHIRGGVERDVATEVDESALAAAVEEAAKDVERDPVEGTISVADGEVSVTPSSPGLSVDVPGTVDEIAARWPSPTPIRAVTEEVEPAVGAEEVERVAAEVAEPAMSGPIEVTTGGRSFRVPASAIAPALSFEVDGDTLAPVLDQKKVVQALRSAGRQADVLRPARDAEVVVRHGRPVVEKSRDGRQLVRAGVADKVLAALTSDDRTVAVTVRRTKPDLTTADVRGTLPRERISTFTTHLPYNPDRTENIRIAANTINNTYVAPGETFSLNKTLGKRTAAKGYNEAPVIVNGRLTTDHGGGISQLSTTLFNAVFFSGARIEEYLAHSFYISRYPEGREATVSWPNVDQKFTNDTGAGILIRARVSGDEVTVTFRGQKKYDIKAVKSARRNIVQPREIRDDSPGCVPQEPSPGFDVSVTRIFLQHGKEVRRSVFRTHYIPEDRVICTN